MTDADLKSAWANDPQLEIIREIVFGGCLREKHPDTARIEMRSIIKYKQEWIQSIHERALAEMPEPLVTQQLPPNPLKDAVGAKWNR